MNLEAAARFESGGIVKHLENKRAASAHLNLTDIEAKAKECFEEGTLAVGLASNCNDFRDGESLAKCYGGSLKAVVSLKARLGI